MNARAMVLVVGAVLFIAGAIGLLVPVSASSTNLSGNTERVGCGVPIAGGDTSEAAKKDGNLGNTAAGVATDLGQGQIANAIPQTHFVAACDSAVSTRLSWSIPVAVIGLVVIGASVVIRGSRSPAR
jgi:hypothetical protein